MGTPTQVCVWSCPNFSAPAGRPFRCVKSKVCDWYWKRKDVTQGDWVEMDVVLNYVKLLTCKVLMSNLMFVDPESSTQADGAQSFREPVPLPEDPFEAIRTARMDVRVPHAMSSGLSAGMAEVAAMSESMFRKRFWSSYESSPSVSPPVLASRKRYRGTLELV
ncbi:hypothetical protein Tco_1561309 [Tanacetum coccineum]